MLTLSGRIPQVLSLDCPDPAMSPSAPSPPSSILIVGAGVFGLSTVLPLLLSPRYIHTRITILDTHAPLPSLTPSESHNPHAASIDNSRIIRADYSNPLYTVLALKAQQTWRNKYAKHGIYRESGVAIVGEKGRSGREYIEKSRSNVGSQIHSHGEGRIQNLGSQEDIKAALKTDGSSGSAGYINCGSGWADAAAAMANVRRRVNEEAGKQRRQIWRRGKAVELVYDNARHSAHTSGTESKRPKVTGVRLESGETLQADLVILAAGAWTGALVDLRGRAEATAQVLAYISLTPGERSQLQSMPVLLNLGTGLFAIPPSPAADSLFKVARHGYGYRNPTPIIDPATGESRIVSLPSSHFSPIPSEGSIALREFLKDLVPWLAERPFTHTRMCWYTDTPTGDFIVDFHPEIEGLFLATGGSGHAFKFLPVIGEKVMEALEGMLDSELRSLWAWPEAVHGFSGTEDGSRGGGKGMLLREEWERGKESKERNSRL